ncbi:glycosyltransferase family 4 protein [Marinicaulis aureus]|uniref:Glycosyltransferase family 4 protein n=1 Tax=Hyphococcus aureus TaxID=2666033 RepID=A0ABW1KT78_9PROT
MKFLYSHRTRAADGQRVHISALTHALEARGHEVVMCGPDAEPARKLDASSQRGLTGLLPAPVYECAEYGYSFPAHRRLSAAAAQSAPDILYERYNLFFHAGGWLKRKTGLPFILEVNAPLAAERAEHGNLFFKGWARASERAIWREADIVLPVTNALAEYVRAAGVPEARIQVIQNGVDDDFLASHDPASVRAQYGLEGKLVLGFTGFVREWHGLDRAVRFLAQAPRDDLHLFIVGDGPARAGLERLASELGVAGRVTFAGVVQREAMAAHVAAFDIALQPAVVPYASPLKLFEYMAQGKPVIAPESANIREVLTSGEDGLLFGVGGFEGALAALIDDADLRARLGAAAAEKVKRRDYTWAGNARRVEEIAERLKDAAA